MSDHPTRIVLLGTHGQYNIGDELLLATFLEQLGTEHSYVINTYDATDTARRLPPGLDAEFIDTAGDRLALLRHLWRTDAVVFAGGSVVKELSAATQRNRYSTLLMILAVVTATRWLARAPIAMLNVGVGPIRTSLGRRLAALILAQATFVTVRDEASRALCSEIGVRNGVISSADAVFSVEPQWLRGGRDRDSLPMEGTDVAARPLRIGLSLNRDIEVPGNWEHVVSTLAEALAGIAADRAVEVHGLPMQLRGKVHDDASVLEDFAARVPQVSFVQHRPEDHEHVATIIERCDLVIAERLHAIILCAKLGVPVVPLAYDVKVRQVAAALGIDHLSVDLARRFDAADVRSSIEQVVGDLQAARSALEESTTRLTVRARRDFAVVRTWLAGATA